MSKVDEEEHKDLIIDFELVFFILTVNYESNIKYLNIKYLNELLKRK